MRAKLNKKFYESENNENMKNELKYGEYYTCKRLRLLSFLKQRGFTEWTTIPDFSNPKYNLWITKNSPQLEAAVDEYFSTKTKH